MDILVQQRREDNRKRNGDRDDDEDVLKRDPDRLKKVGVAEDKREVGEAEAGIRASQMLIVFLDREEENVDDRVQRKNTDADCEREEIEERLDFLFPGTVLYGSFAGEIGRAHV